MRQIITKILTDAPQVRVWKVLTDFNNYSTWNPFITKVRGSAQKGTRLTVNVSLSSSHLIVYKPKIVDIEWGRWLVLQGRLITIFGFTTGEHVLTIEHSSSQKKVRITQKHSFHGIAALHSWKCFEPVSDGIDLMNTALKDHLEKTDEQQRR